MLIIFVIAFVSYKVGSNKVGQSDFPEMQGGVGRMVVTNFNEVLVHINITNNPTEFYCGTPDWYLADYYEKTNISILLAFDIQTEERTQGNSIYRITMPRLEIEKDILQRYRKDLLERFSNRSVSKVVCFTEQLFDNVQIDIYDEGFKESRNNFISQPLFFVQCYDRKIPTLDRWECKYYFDFDVYEPYDLVKAVRDVMIDEALK